MSPYGPQPPTQQHQTNAYFGQNGYPSNGQSIGRGRGAKIPAWMNVAQPRQIGSQGIPPPPPPPPQPAEEGTDNYSTQSQNFAAEYVQFLQVNNASSSNLRPMPIRTQNELPHVKFSIGCEPSSIVGLSLLYDTGAALNTGYDAYHKQIMKAHPQMVAKFETFDGDNPFDPIKLCGAITSPEDYDVSKHGVLSAVIEYHTPYMCKDGRPFLLALALGSTMSVNSILGLPTIIEGDLVPSWQAKVYLSHTFQTKFPIVFMQTKRAQPEKEQTNSESCNTAIFKYSPNDVSTQFRSAFANLSRG